MVSQAYDVFQNIIDPIFMMVLAASYIPGTILSLLLSFQFRTLLTPSLFKDAWFARFWTAVGPQTRENATPRVEPLISQASGVVLDIGPGSGEWLDLFDKSKITKIYGVEPNKDHHAALKKKIQNTGLEGLYEIVPVGVEDLSGNGKEGKVWVKKETVDCLVTIQCLCSVPGPKIMIGELYGYLKVGGNWIVYEHVVTHVGGIIAMYQSACDLFWPHFLGGCSLTRDTEKWLKEAGSWNNVDLRQPVDEKSYNMVPHVMGILTK